MIHCADVESTTRIEGLTITGGVLTGIGCAYTGAGIYCERSSPTIASCNISSNTAGGGGGLSCCQNSAPSFVNVVICGNSAEAGAGMACDHSAPTLANCMFSENTAPGGYGGGIHPQHSQASASPPTQLIWAVGCTGIWALRLS